MAICVHFPSKPAIPACEMGFKFESWRFMLYLSLRFFVTDHRGLCLEQGSSDCNHL